jgi:SAM-dependent methyltransferase
MVAEVERRRAGLAPAAAARLHPVVGDIRDPAPAGPFALVLLAMNTLQVLLAPEDQLRCLSACRARLAPGGEVAFDVAMPDLGEIMGTLGIVRATGIHHDPATGVTLFHSACYDAFDPVTQTLDFHLTIDERRADGTLARHLRPHRVHLFLPAELEHLLARAGLETVERFGGFDGAPVEAGSERQVHRCRAAA